MMAAAASADVSFVQRNLCMIRLRTFLSFGLLSGRLCLRLLAHPLQAKVDALLLQHTRDDIERTPRHREKGFDRVVASVFAFERGMAGAQHDSLDFRFEDHPQAHRAGFKSPIERSAGEL